MKHIAENVRRIRQSRNWSQEQLAEMVAVTVRTIQRVEKGETVSEETLRDIATVFEIDREDLNIDAKEFLANLEAGIEKLKAESVELVLHRMAHGHELGALLSAHASLVDCQTDDAAVRDLAAEFEQALVDEIDIWGDYGAVDRRRAEKHMTEWIERFEKVGFSMYAGSQSRLVPDKSGVPPLCFECLVVSIVRTSGLPFYRMLLPKKASLRT